MIEEQIACAEKDFDIANYDLWKRRWAKLHELDKHDERDRARWHACMDRRIELGTSSNA